MRNYIERAKDFIKQVYPYIAPCRNPWGARDRIKMFNADFDRKVIVSNGLARIALITSDYVVKFDYDPEEVDCIGGCEQEIKIYNIAKREGFGYLFAEITRYEYHNRYFYIMPRIRGIGKFEYECADMHMTDDENEFCDRLHITDLHSNNYGFRNGHVCIIDYACSLDYDSSESDTEDT